MDKEYMLISVIEREILTERFYTFEGAFQTMISEMIQAGAPKDILDEIEYDDGTCGFNEDGGYVTDGIGSENFDWRIVLL